MPTPTKGPRLGSGPAHQRLMLRGLAGTLFERGRVVTTHAKAKRLRPVAERLITFARRGDLHARRQVLREVPAKAVVHRLFSEIGPRFADRAGGYTRITKLGHRPGDGAPMAVIELVEARPAEQEVLAEAERARGGRFRRRAGGTSPAAGPTVAEGALPEPVPTGGDVEPATTEVGPDETEQVAVPTEGGDTTVVSEPSTAEPPEPGAE